MDSRRCEYCGRALHPKARADARFCSRTCKSSGHRWKKENPELAIQPFQRQVPAEYAQLAQGLIHNAPAGAKGYQLVKEDCPYGTGLFRFPVPLRPTKHADNTLRSTLYYQLLPFEPPRVPWPGSYEVLYFVPERGFVPPVHDKRLMADGIPTVPRAAWDKQALWKFVPKTPGSQDGNSTYLAAHILDRAPRGALGYQLVTDRSARGFGHFVFPVPGRPTRRSDGRLMQTPYFSLDPYETPVVPWPGTYALLFVTPPEGSTAHRERPTIYVGHIYPHAEYDRAAQLPIIEITEADQHEMERNRKPMQKRRRNAAARKRPRPA
jgi:hypothetical protein